MNGPTRRIFNSGRTTQAEMAGLVQWLFLAELLAPGDTLWVVAPVIDNAPLLDNTTGCFDALDPSWGARKVRLLDLVLRLAGMGHRLVLATRKPERSAAFLDELRATVADHGLESLVRVQERPWLSTCGILTRHGVLRGALALESEGIRPLDDVVILDTAAEDLAAARVAFEAASAEGS
jgi:hypothetical protein